MPVGEMEVFKRGCRALRLCIVPAFFVVPAALADEPGTEKKPWSVELSGGLEYDDNVSVAELDATTGVGDFAGVVEFRAEYAPKLDKNTSLYIGYDFFQSLYFDLTGFDIQSHLVTVSLDRKVGPVTVGAMYNFAYAFLGSDDFLEFHKLSPYIGFFPADRIYVRAFYEYTDKSIFPSPARDTRDQAGGADVYFFLKSAKTYVSTGYRYESVDAAGPEFDYTGHNFRAKFVTSFPIGQIPSKVKIGGRYEMRGYDNITPSIATIRDDDIFRLSAEWRLPLGRYFFSELKYEYGDYSSNLPTADFTRNAAMVRFGASY
jgi:hypothetical protein